MLFCISLLIKIYAYLSWNELYQNWKVGFMRITQSYQKLLKPEASGIKLAILYNSIKLHWFEWIVQVRAQKKLGIRHKRKNNPKVFNERKNMIIFNRLGDWNHFLT